MKESLSEKKARARSIIKKLEKTYPDATCALEHSNHWELLTATILSAQCTDKLVNKVTPALFHRFPDPESVLSGMPGELEKLIQSTGFYKNKAKNIRGAAAALVKNHGGKIPSTLEELVQLPGVGRKTANVVLGYGFGIPGLTVDTHMIRLNNLLGFTKSRDAVKIEFELMPIIPQKDWTHYSDLIIHHGRSRCIARRPDCANCEIRGLCPSAKK